MGLYAVAVYAVMLVLGITQNRDGLIRAAAIAAWSIAADMIVTGWRPWPRA